MTKPTPPVPPDELIEPSRDQLTQFLVELTRCHTIASKRMFVRQWVRDWTRHKLTAQAIPEREELAGLLGELLRDLEGLGIRTRVITRERQRLLSRTRAAAERLRGGDADD